MFSVFVIGSSSAIPVFGRHLSAQMVEHNDRLILIDCGEGTQFQITQYHLKIRRLDLILISHLHGDHVFGLPGLLTTMSMSNRTAPLVLAGPVGLKNYLSIIFEATGSVLKYPLEIRELEPKPKLQAVYENEGLTIAAFPLSHQIPCLGYRIAEKPKKPKFLFYKAMEAGVPKEYFHLIKQGTDVELLNGETLLAADYLGEPDPPLTYCYCSDTKFDPAVADYARGATLLYHEATFLNEHADRAAETYHSTAEQAAQIAQKAGAGRLLLGHFSARYFQLDQHLREARPFFENTDLAAEGVAYPVGA